LYAVRAGGEAGDKVAAILARHDRSRGVRRGRNGNHRCPGHRRASLIHDDTRQRTPADLAEGGSGQAHERDHEQRPEHARDCISL
jgi:hypothetical protein